MNLDEINEKYQRSNLRSNPETIAYNSRQSIIIAAVDGDTDT